MARPARLSAWLVLAALPGFSRASSNTTRSSTKSGGGDFDPDKSWWILSTDKNRQAGEMLYLQGPSSDDGGALRGLQLDGENPIDEAKFILLPAKGEKGTETYHIVGAYESRAAGYNVFLDYDGTTQVLPYSPKKPDPQAEWRILPYDEGYHIVSSRVAQRRLAPAIVGCAPHQPTLTRSGRTSAQRVALPRRDAVRQRRLPDVSRVCDDVVPVQQPVEECRALFDDTAPSARLVPPRALSGHPKVAGSPRLTTRYNKTDVEATFSFLAAPPSPPIDYAEVKKAYDRLVLTNTIFFVIATTALLVFFCYLCVWPAIRPKVDKERTTVSGPFVVPRNACPAFVWPRTSYERVP